MSESDDDYSDDLEPAPAPAAAGVSNGNDTGSYDDYSYDDSAAATAATAASSSAAAPPHPPPVERPQSARQRTKKGKKEKKERKEKKRKGSQQRSGSLGATSGAAGGYDDDDDAEDGLGECDGLDDGGLTLQQQEEIVRRISADASGFQQHQQQVDEGNGRYGGRYRSPSFEQDEKYEQDDEGAMDEEVSRLMSGVGSDGAATVPAAAAYGERPASAAYARDDVGHERRPSSSSRKAEKKLEKKKSKKEKKAKKARQGSVTAATPASSASYVQSPEGDAAVYDDDDDDAAFTDEAAAALARKDTMSSDFSYPSDGATPTTAAAAATPVDTTPDPSKKKAKKKKKKASLSEDAALKPQASEDDGKSEALRRLIAQANSIGDVGDESSGSDGETPPRPASAAAAAEQAPAAPAPPAPTPPPQQQQPPPRPTAARGSSGRLVPTPPTHSLPLHDETASSIKEIPDEADLSPSSRSSVGSPPAAAETSSAAAAADAANRGVRIVTPTHTHAAEPAPSAVAAEQESAAEAPSAQQQQQQQEQQEREANAAAAARREDAMAARIRDLERRLAEKEQEQTEHPRRASSPNGGGGGGGGGGQRASSAPRPHSAPATRASTAQSAALIRRCEAQAAPPNCCHVFRPKHTLTTSHACPSKRERHTSVRMGDNMFVWGGKGGRGTSAEAGPSAGAAFSAATHARASELDPSLYAFNVRTAAWKRIATVGSKPSSGRHSHTASLCGVRLPWTDPSEPQSQSMIIFGGVGPQPPTYGQATRNPYGAHTPSTLDGGETTAASYSYGTPAAALGRESAAAASFCRDVYSLDMETKRWTRVDGDSVSDDLVWSQGGGGDDSPSCGAAAAGEAAAEYEGAMRAVGQRMPDRDVTAVRSHTAVVYSRRLWIFGGMRQTGVSSHLDTIHLKKMKWVPLKHTSEVRPHGVMGHTAVVWGGSMWVYGGVNSNSDRVDTVYSYSFNVGAWTKKDCGGESPEARSGHAAQVFGRSMLVYGGSTGPMEYSGDCHMLNLGSLLWEKIELQCPPSLLGRRYCVLNVFPVEDAENAPSGADSGCDSPQAADGVAADASSPRNSEGRLLCRAFAMGGGGDAEHASAYNANQYHCRNDIAVLDFAGGWPHAARCDGLATSSMYAGGHEGVDTDAHAGAGHVRRPVSVQLPMRYSRFETWHIHSAFDPVTPLVSQKPDRKLTDEEVAKMSERLSIQTLQTRQKKLEELRARLCQSQKTKKLTKEEEDKAVERMYSQHVNKQKKQVADTQAKLARERRSRPRIDSTQLKVSVNRLHTQAIKHREDTMKKLTGQVMVTRPEGKKLAPDERERVNKDLYYDRVKATKAKREALLEKYLHSAASGIKHKSKSEEQAVTARLFNDRKKSAPLYGKSVTK